MPKTITLFRVFVASPSDVADERNIVGNVIDELNISYGSYNNVKLELIGWEKNVFPSIGDDAQDVINSQINDEYDIFVGIMWGRFGSPTKRNQSGTKEEFERAFLKYKKNKTAVSIMLYFKTAPISVVDIDPDQIKNINVFKQELKEKGVLYGQFTQIDEFEKIFRLNLTVLLNSLINNSPHENEGLITITNNNEVDSPNIDESEEIGLYENIDIAVQYMQDMLPILIRISKYIADLGTKINRRTSKINNASNKPFNVQQREVGKSMDMAAEDLNEFTLRTKVEIPILNEHFSEAIKYYNNAITIFKSYNTDENEHQAIFQSLTKLKDSINGSMEGVTSMKSSIAQTPSLTTKYGKAKKSAIKVLTELQEEFATDINLIEELSKNLLV